MIPGGLAVDPMLRNTEFFKVVMVESCIMMLKIVT